MRILHTADWHFGKTLEGRDRAAEQWEFIEELIRVCDDERIDLVLMAGDVYQTVNPSAEAEAMFYQALEGLSAGGRRAVVVIAGNHDHAERIAAARPLADRLGITLAGLPKDVLMAAPQSDGANRRTSLVQRVRGGTGFVELALPACDERAVVALVPYPSEARLNEVLAQNLDERELQAQYNQRLRAWFAMLGEQFRPDAVNLAMSHLYVNGGLESDSEVQIQIGGAYAVDPDVFPAAAQYVALGHLHRPQTVGGAADGAGRIRYAGSPLAYSFSEAGQAKSVTVIDAKPGRPAGWREVPLMCGRPLARWRATEGLAQVQRWVAEGRDGEAWIDLEVHVQTGLQLEEIHRLRDLHPRFVHIRPVLPAQADESHDDNDEQGPPPLAEMFRRYFAERQGVTPDDQLVSLFLELAADGETADGDTVDLRGEDV